MRRSNHGNGGHFSGDGAARRGAASTTRIAARRAINNYRDRIIRQASKITSFPNVARRHGKCRRSSAEVVAEFTYWREVKDHRRPTWTTATDNGQRTDGRTKLPSRPSETTIKKKKSRYMTFSLFLPSLVNF